MVFSNRTHYYLMGKLAMSGIASKNMFTLVIGHIETR